MTAAVRAAGEVADLVFVSVHWGVELDTQPRADDVARAHAMIDAGADGVFGHHSHRLQPLGSYSGRPIAWGLGNFVWPTLSDAGSRSAVAEFVVTPDGAVQRLPAPGPDHLAGHPELVGARSCGVTGRRRRRAGSDRQHDLAGGPARLTEPVRVGGLVQRERLVHQHPQPPASTRAASSSRPSPSGSTIMPTARRPRALRRLDRRQPRPPTAG